MRKANKAEWDLSSTNDAQLARKRRQVLGCRFNAAVLEPGMVWEAPPSP